MLVWRALGRDGDRAIGIGLGAGVFEAILLAMSALITTSGLLDAAPKISGTPGEQLNAGAVLTSLIWLVGPVERAICIVCHTSSRALVLLGTAHRKPMLVVGGFLIFTLIDGIGSGVMMSGKLATVSLWWLEVALLPVALVSLPILWWCHVRWGGPAKSSDQNEAARAEAANV